MERVVGIRHVCRMSAQVVSSALGIWVGRAQGPSGAVAEMVEAWNKFGVKWLIDLCCGVVAGSVGWGFWCWFAGVDESAEMCLYRAIGLLEQAVRVVGQMLACRIWR